MLRRNKKPAVADTEPEEVELVEPVEMDKIKNNVKTIVKQYYSSAGKYAFRGPREAKNATVASNDAKKVMENSMANLWIQALTALKANDKIPAIENLKENEFDAMKHAVTMPSIGTKYIKLKNGKILGPLMAQFGLGGKFYGGLWDRDAYKHNDLVINNVLFGVATGGDEKSNFDRKWEDPKSGWVKTLKKFHKEIKDVPQAKKGGKGRRRTKKRRKRNLKKRTRRRRRRQPYILLIRP